MSMAVVIWKSIILFFTKSKIMKLKIEWINSFVEQFVDKPLVIRKCRIPCWLNLRRWNWKLMFLVFPWFYFKVRWKLLRWKLSAACFGELSLNSPSSLLKRKCKRAFPTKFKTMETEIRCLECFPNIHFNQKLLSCSALT